MTALVHVYDPLTERLVTVGLDTEVHTMAAINTTGPGVEVWGRWLPCDLICEIELHRELAYHNGRMQIPHPRMN